MALLQNRREFAASLSLAGAAALIGSAPALADEGPPETTTVRFAKAPGICIAPQYVAEETAPRRGIHRLAVSSKRQAGLTATAMVARGELDFSIDFATAFVIPIDCRRADQGAVAASMSAATNCSRTTASKASAT